MSIRRQIISPVITMIEEISAMDGSTLVQQETHQAKLSMATPLSLWASQNSLMRWRIDINFLWNFES